MMILISLTLSQIPHLKMSYQVRDIKKIKMKCNNHFSPPSLESETKKVF